MKDTLNDSLRTFCKMLRDAYEEGYGRPSIERTIPSIMEQRWQASEAKTHHDFFWNQITD